MAAYDDAIAGLRAATQASQSLTEAVMLKRTVLDEAAAAAATAAAVAGQARDGTTADRTQTAADRLQTSADRATAVAARMEAATARDLVTQLAGVSKTFAAKAEADAAVGTVAANAIVLVLADETRGARACLYRKDGGGLAFVKYGDVVLIEAADRGALKTARGTIALLREHRREGTFVWDATVAVARHRADPQEGIYVAPVADAPGAWRRLHNGIFNTKWFGTVAGGDIFAARGDDDSKLGTLVDDYVPLMAAIKLAIREGASLESDAEVMAISKPLLISSTFTSAGGTKTHWDQTHLRWTGAGGGSQVSNRAITAIRLLSKDTFALGIQCGFGVRIQGMAFFGSNNVRRAYRAAGSNGSMLRSDIWNTDGCRDTRYSPQAGIVVDPFARYIDGGGPVPPDGGYPGYAHLYQYENGESSGIILDDVTSVNFVVGGLFGPSGRNLSSEISMTNVVFDYCRYGYSSGQDQARNHVWIAGSTAVCEWGFTGVHHGAQRGNIPFINGLNAAVKYLFASRPDLGVPSVSARNIHAETIGSIGFIGGIQNAGQNSAIIGDSHFSLGFNFDNGGDVACADLHLYATVDVVFERCVINVASPIPGGVGDLTALPPIRFATLNSTITFRDSPIVGGGGTEVVLPALDTSNLRFENCRVSQDHGPSGSINGQTPMGQNLTARTWARGTVDRTYAVDGQTMRFADDPDGYSIASAGGRLPLAGGQLARLTVDQAVCRATFASAGATAELRRGDHVALESAIAVERFQPGAFVFGKHPTTGIIAGTIEKVEGDVVTICGIPQSLVTGDYYLTHVWRRRIHRPSTGSVTAGSAQIAAVTATDTWAVNDRIHGTGIPAGTRIDAVDTAARTITLSKPATATGVDVRLYDADVRRIASVPV